MSLLNKAAETNVLYSENLLGEVAIAEGCVVVEGTADDAVKLPAGALASRIRGVSISAGTSNGTTEKVAVASIGICPVLLAATLTIARGDELVVANASGHVRKRVAADATGCVVGTSKVDRTAGATAEFITCSLNIHEIVGL